MKVSVSNIAWDVADNEWVAALLNELGISAIEVAPTKIWDFPQRISDAEITAQRRFWEDRGIQVVAMQSLLFGQSTLQIFGNGHVQAETLEYLSGMIKLAGKMGATRLVFGSPKNRRSSHLPPSEIVDASTKVFRHLGDVAMNTGVVFCIEPNPVHYNCDFVTNTMEGIELVKRVDSPGFGLHLDAGVITLNEEPLSESIGAAGDLIQHFHISEPMLAPIGTGVAEHALLARALRSNLYCGFASVEMLPPEQGKSALRDSLSCAMSVYAK